MEQEYKNNIEQIVMDSTSQLAKEIGITLTNIGNDTPLMGSLSIFSSVDLVALIIDIEERVLNVLKIQICLTDDRAMSQKTSPFRTITTLTNYIVNNIKA